MMLYGEAEYPDAEIFAKATFDEAWKLTGAIFGLSWSEILDRYAASHIMAITLALHKAYRAGCAYGDQQAKEFFARDC